MFPGKSSVNALLDRIGFSSPVPLGAKQHNSIDHLEVSSNPFLLTPWQHSFTLGRMPEARRVTGNFLRYTSARYYLKGYDEYRQAAVLLEDAWTALTRYPVTILS